MRIPITYGLKRGGAEGLAHAVGKALAESGPEADVRRARERSPTRRALPRLLRALCLFTGVTATWGGIELAGWPAGGAPGFQVPLSVLEHTPFRDFFVPGLLLLLFVGLSNLVSWWLLRRRHRWGALMAFGAGGALTVWIVTEMVMLRSVHWLEWLYLAIGLGTMAAALRSANMSEARRER